jgi:hypothetical protein
MSPPSCTRKTQPRPTDVRHDAVILPSCSSIDLLPVWADFDSVAQLYDLAMCHDDQLGNSFLTRTER